MLCNRSIGVLCTSPLLRKPAGHAGPIWRIFSTLHLKGLQPGYQRRSCEKLCTQHGRIYYLFCRRQWKYKCSDSERCHVRLIGCEWPQWCRHIDKRVLEKELGKNKSVARLLRESRVRIRHLVIPYLRVERKKEKRLSKYFPTFNYMCLQNLS